VGKSQRVKTDREISFFGNLTAHIGEKTELSGGLRHIDYKTDAGLCSYPSPQAGGFRFTTPFAGPPFETTTPCAFVPTFEFHDKWNTWIYTASAKYEFSDDLMVYASTGTSWRPGIFPGGFQAAALSDRQRDFLILPPEKSTSYEIGVKSSFLDKRMNLNVDGFYQKFKNFPYRPSSAVSFVTPGATTVTTRPGFVAALPVKVYGIELEWTYAPTDRWDLGVSSAYTKTKTSGGLVPCNDYVAPFGEADPPGLTYTASQIMAATGGQGIGACPFDQSPAMAPKWSANARAEYHVPIGDAMNGYIRGLLSWFGTNDPNDPLNPVDQVKSYALFNLYAGLRDSSGRWEISFYGKNITDTFRVLSRESGVFTPQFGVVGAAPVVPQYRRVLGTTAPREFGLTVRYAFGSR
jgi:iron complex outermembrane receptor protein